jgi:hypothetical protein
MPYDVKLKLQRQDFLMRENVIAVSQRPAHGVHRRSTTANGDVKSDSLFSTPDQSPSLSRSNGKQRRGLEGRVYLKILLKFYFLQLFLDKTAIPLRDRKPKNT